MPPKVAIERSSVSNTKPVVDNKPPCAGQAEGDNHAANEDTVTNNEGQPAAAQQLTMHRGNEGAAAPAPVATNARRHSDDQLNNLLERAVRYRPLIRSQRNDNYMYIGRYVHRQGCTPAYLAALKYITASATPTMSTNTMILISELSGDILMLKEEKVKIFQISKDNKAQGSHIMPFLRTSKNQKMRILPLICQNKDSMKTAYLTSLKFLPPLIYPSFKIF